MKTLNFTVIIFRQLVTVGKKVKNWIQYEVIEDQ